MGEMITTELRSFLTQYKDIVSIESDEFYKLVTISNKGIIGLREIRQGKDIKADKEYRIKTGSFIYSRLAAHTGSFGLVPPELDGAVVTGEMPVFKINYDIILPDYFLYLLRQKKFFNILYQLTKGMGRVRIREESLLEIRLSIHKDIVDQKRIVESLNSRFNEIEALDYAHSDQIDKLNQTRRVILQEAIEGKLTAKWRKLHPELISGDNHASKLLEKIKTEKERLIKEGKIRKDKSITPITDGEKPFDLPDGWVWCRLGEICECLSTGPFGSMLHKSDYVEGGIPIINPTHIEDGQIYYDNRMCVSHKTRERLKRYSLKQGDFVIARRGNLSKCAVVNSQQDGWLCGTGSFFLRILCVNNTYIRMAYSSAKSQVYLLQDSIGQTMDNLNQKLLRKLPIALPPIDEQQIIIEQVYKLIGMTDDLEKQVFDRKEQSEMLMQSVLREAFVNGD